MGTYLSNVYIYFIISKLQFAETSRNIPKVPGECVLFFELPTGYLYRWECIGGNYTR